MTGRHRVGHGRTGPLHERDPGRAAADRQPVGRGHFGRAQKLKHCAPTIMVVAGIAHIKCLSGSDIDMIIGNEPVFYAITLRRPLATG